MEGKKKSLLQKMSNLQQEKETLEIEIMAANEKLQLLARKYHDRKNKQRSKLRTSRFVYFLVCGIYIDHIVREQPRLSG